MKKEDFEFHHTIVKENDIYFVQVDIYCQVKNKEDQRGKFKCSLSVAIDSPQKTISEIEVEAKTKALDFLKDVVGVLYP